MSLWSGGENRRGGLLGRGRCGSLPKGRGPDVLVALALLLLLLRPELLDDGALLVAQLPLAQAIVDGGQEDVPLLEARRRLDQLLEGRAGALRGSARTALPRIATRHPALNALAHELPPITSKIQRV